MNQNIYKSNYMSFVNWFMIHIIFTWIDSTTHKSLAEDTLDNLNELRLRIVKESNGLIKDEKEIETKQKIKLLIENKISNWINNIELINKEIEEFHKNSASASANLNSNYLSNYLFNNSIEELKKVERSLIRTKKIFKYISNTLITLKGVITYLIFRERSIY